VEFSTDPSFTTLAFSVNAGNVSVITTSLQGNTVYYWRVKSNNGGHESAYSAVRTFTTATGSANLVYPADLATGIAINPVFVWDPVPGADSYTLQVSTSATFTTQSMVYNTAGLTGTSQQVNGLNPNTLYYWRVRSALGTTQGFYSAKFSFTTGTSTGITDTDLFSGISVSPVPAKDHVTVSGYMKKSSVVDIAIHSVEGKRLIVESHDVKQGLFTLQLDTRRLPSGIYFVNIHSEGHESVLRIAIY
jgi:hypothetical protein